MPLRRSSRTRLSRFATVTFVVEVKLRSPEQAVAHVQALVQWKRKPRRMAELSGGGAGNRIETVSAINHP